MDTIFHGKASAIFVFKSDLSPEHLCQAIQSRYALPSFILDEHSTWEYAFSAGESVGFNITKTTNFGKISEWMKDAPMDVNYQIILFIRDKNFSDMDYQNFIQGAYLELFNIIKREIIQIYP